MVKGVADAPQIGYAVVWPFQKIGNGLMPHANVAGQGRLVETVSADMPVKHIANMRWFFLWICHRISCSKEVVRPNDEVIAPQCMGGNTETLGGTTHCLGKRTCGEWLYDQLNGLYDPLFRSKDRYNEVN